jgi:hypothetical protein
MSGMKSGRGIKPLAMGRIYQRWKARATGNVVSQNGMAMGLRSWGEGKSWFLVWWDSGKGNMSLNSILQCHGVNYNTHIQPVFQSVSYGSFKM